MITQKKNKLKLLKEKKRNVTCIFDRLVRNHGKNLAFSSKNKWDYSLKMKKKQFNMQWPVLISFSLSISFLFLIFLCFCVLLHSRSSCEMKKYDIVLAAAIFSGVSSINDYLWPFFHCKLLRFTSSFNAFFVFVQIFQIAFITISSMFKTLVGLIWNVFVCISTDKALENRKTNFVRRKLSPANCMKWILTDTQRQIFP